MTSPFGGGAMPTVEYLQWESLLIKFHSRPLRGSLKRTNAVSKDE